MRTIRVLVIAVVACVLVGQASAQTKMPVELVVPLTSPCRAELEATLAVLPGSDKPTVEITDVTYSPSALSQVVAFARISFGNSKYFNPKEFLEGLYLTCSASFSTSVGISESDFGSVLQFYLRQFRKEGAENLNVRLVDDKVEIFGVSRDVAESSLR